MRKTLIIAFLFIQQFLHAQTDTLFYWDNITKPCTITFITDDDILFKTVEFSSEQTVSKKHIQGYWRDGQFYLYKKGFYVKQDNSYALTHTIKHNDGGAELRNLTPGSTVGPIYHARNYQVAGAACMFIGFGAQYIISLSKPDLTKTGTLKTFRAASQISAALIVLGAGLELNGIILVRKNSKRYAVNMGVGNDGAFCALRF